MAAVQVDYSPFQPGSFPQPRIGRCQNPYFRHGDALYPFMYAAFVGWLCHIRIFPPWLILLLLSPMYVGGVKLVIVMGKPLSPLCQACSLSCVLLSQCLRL